MLSVSYATALLWTKTRQILRKGLVALDCIEQGVGRRDIAVALYGEARVAEGWNDDRGSLRGAVKYLVCKVEDLRDGGYLMELLGAQVGPNKMVA